MGTTDDVITESKAQSEGRVSWGFWIGLIVLLGATGYVVTSSMSNTVHYYDVDQVVGQDELVGDTMRLRGLVVDDSHRVRQGSLDEHVFLLAHNQRAMTVLFKGALPDQFQDRASVVATGVMTAPDTFEAESLTAQCPSRYENAAPTAQQNEMMGGTAPGEGGEGAQQGPHMRMPAEASYE
jgi:cytochrome c-type biogenesis protein CcmE